MPSNHSEHTKRIAKNTLFLYIRSLFNLFLSLYTSRLVLQALGQDDYGLYNVVGAFVAMFWMLSTSITSSITRFLNFEMGLGSIAGMKKVFQNSLLLVFILSAIICIAIETFGLWYLNHKMVVPIGRESAAYFVFQISIITSIIALFAAPFNSAIIAHEKMSIYAFVGMAETLLLFLLALLMDYAKVYTDILIFYALARFFVAIFIQVVIVVYARKHFTECSLKLRYDRFYTRSMLGFAGWNLLGSVCVVFSGHGINMLLNSFFGTAVNAARGLAFTVSNSVGIFVNNFTAAVVPQITKSYAGKDMDYLKNLLFYSSKLSFFIMLYFVMPLVLETPFVLNVWLAEVPEYTVNFVRLALSISLVEMLDGIIWNTQLATGKIRKNRILNSMLNIFIFILSFFALRMGFRPEAVYIVSIICSLAKVVVNVSIIINTIYVSFKEIMGRIFFPEILVTALSATLPIIPHILMPYGYLRFLIVGVTSVLSITLFIFMIGFSYQERIVIFNKLSLYFSGAKRLFSCMKLR